MRDIFFVQGEYGVLDVERTTGKVLDYTEDIPDDSDEIGYASITRFDIAAYEALFRTKIQAGSRIDIVNFNFWESGAEQEEYRKRDPMPTDPKPPSSKEINDNFIEAWKDTSEVDHTGRDTISEFLVTVHKDYNSKLVSVDYDFAKHCWILTAFECIAPTKMIIHRITFPHQSWTSDSVQEKRIKECIGALGLHPTTGVCSKTEVLDFLGFGEAFCLHKGDKPNG